MNQTDKIDIVYTYWSSEQTYAACILKEKGLIKSIITRTHGYDIYEERRQNNYMPLKRQFLPLMDKIYVLSEQAKLYLTCRYQIQENKDNYLVNLASDEYSKAIDINELRVPCLTPVFKDFKNGKLKVISFFAKKARVKMCRFIIKNKLTSINELQEFNCDGYLFDKNLSTDSEFIYTR